MGSSCTANPYSDEHYWVELDELVVGCHFCGDEEPIDALPMRKAVPPMNTVQVNKEYL